MEEKQPVKTKEKAKTKGENSFLLKAGRGYQKYLQREEVWQSLEAILTLVTVILLLLFAISPTVRAISDLVSEIEDKEKLSGQMTSKVNQIVTAQVSYGEIQEKLLLLEQYYPQTGEMSQGMAQLIALAGEKGISLEQFSLEEFDFVKMDTAKKNDKDSPPGIKFNLSLKGDYFLLKDFLNSAYQVRRGMEIDNYQMAVGEEEGGTIVLRIEGRLLFQPVERE